MPKRSRIREAGYVVLAVATTAVAALFMAGPTTALEQPGIRVSENESIVRQYPTIAGNNPANQAYDPDTCRISLYCDVVRLTIVPPADPETGYFVRVQLSWFTRAEVDVPLEGEVTNNDLDLFIYQVPYDRTKTRAQNEVARGATAAQPETAYVSPAGNYDMVVVNFVGANEQGYKLTVTYVSETEFTPVELLETFDPDKDEPVADTSGEAVPSAAAPLVEAPLAAAPLPPAVFLGGGAFDDPFGLTTPISSISAIGRNILAGPEDGPAPPAGPVSALAVLVWLGLVPLAVVAGGGWVLARRRTGLFTG